MNQNKGFINPVRSLRRTLDLVFTKESENCPSPWQATVLSNGVKGFKKNWLLLIPAVVGSLLSLRYILMVHGLPLDDAYIYQRYVVNLAAGKGFCFNPGEVSFGFTSLLWLLILTGGRLIFPSIDYVHLAQGLGLLSGFLCLYFAQRIVLIQSRSRWLACLIGLYLASSPLFYLNSVSGLETACFTLAALLFYYFLLLRGHERPYLAGFLCGLAFLARPEGLVVFVAVVILYPLYLLREAVRKESSFDLRLGKGLLGFLSGYALIVGPYLIYLWFHTGRFLPGTYLGKILSNNPQILLWGFGRRFFIGIWSFFLGYFNLVSFNQIGNFLLLLLCAFSLVTLLYLFLLREVSEKSFLARLSAASFLLLPFAYGFKFAIHPFFGGYYHRYLLPVLIIFIIEGAIGLGWLIKLAEAYFAPMSIGAAKAKRGVRVLATIGLGGLVFYNFALMKGRFPYDDDIYQRVVYRNTDLRYKAAIWIKENTPLQSRVMVGKTGLGVIGSYSDRYILDEGALINPDIYPYYRAVLKGEDKWAKIVEYMTDRKVDYYVTVPAPGEYSCLQPLTLIKDPDHLPWQFDKIAIYRFISPPSP